MPGSPYYKIAQKVTELLSVVPESKINSSTQKTGGSLKRTTEINSLHPNLKFTLEIEQNGKLPFLDICIEYHETTLSSTWYCKPTDTGLILNFHAMTPRSYKRSVILGFVYQIYRPCSSWKKFHESLIKAKDIFEQNVYPPNFYKLIISATIEKIVKPCNEKVHSDDVNNENSPAKVNLII